jgi:hypothetical protein
MSAHPELLGDPVGKAAISGELEKTGRRGTEFRHRELPPGSTK